MIKRTNMITGSVVMLFAVGLIGCGQGFESQGSVSAISSAGGKQGINNNHADITYEMAKAEEANKSALAAIAEADAALKTVTDSKGNINLNLFKKSSSTADVTTQGLLSPVIDRLRTAFEKVFAKVTVVKTKFAEARQALLTALAKLDQNVPEQAAMIQQVMAQISKIDAMERQFTSKIHMLAGKLDLAVAGIDKLISGVTSFIPGWGWVVNLALDFLVMSDVKDFIYEIKMRLLSV